MKTLFSLFLITGLTINSIAQGNVAIQDSNYIIYSVKHKKIVDVGSIIKDMKKYDVLLYGEAHDDSITHRIQTLLFQLMFSEFGGNATVSMEMFDRDVQYIMDEYLSGKIKKSYFLKDSRKWSNYKDYEPMVEFAKKNGLQVIAANAPFRYVNVATKGGLEALQSLSDCAKTALAPLPYNYADGAYKDKLDKLMGHTPGEKRPSYDMIPGQSLWDATMAYSIQQYNKNNPKSKIIHLNGRFHSEEYFGIYQRLAEYDKNIKALVITGESTAKEFPNIKFEDYTHLGDYIIFTNPNLVKTIKK
ncbi:MAG: hypothetical protein COA97_03730 [Flavobacteriales bacterium]|nr:MAG: hypothetical protein COA97_03730 [Flavobacteriales bacterium]